MAECIDLWNVRKVDESLNVCNDLTENWKYQLTLPQPSFAKALFSFIGIRWWILVFLSTATRTCSVLLPLILGNVQSFVIALYRATLMDSIASVTAIEQILIWLATPKDAPGYDPNGGYKWSGLMFLCSFLSTFLDSQYAWYGERQWVRVCTSSLCNALLCSDAPPVSI
jgi:hypothetical protein